MLQISTLPFLVQNNLRSPAGIGHDVPAVLLSESGFPKVTQERESVAWGEGEDV